MAAAAAATPSSSSQDRIPSLSSSPSKTHSQHVFRGCSSISKYEMLEKLGEGTFGYGLCLGENANPSEVWKAQRTDTKEIFALKKILMHNEKEGV